MKEHAWLRRDGVGEMGFLPLHSSAGRSWSGMEASLFLTSGGVVERAPTATHHLAMNVGRTVRAFCSCDDVTDRGLQSPGHIDIVPLGYAARWEESAPTMVLAINLSEALVRSVAEDVGVNMDVASITPHLRNDDPKLESLGWALKAELESPDRFDRIFADALGVAIATQLLRQYTRAEFPIRRGFSKRHMRVLEEYIEAHLASDLSLAELAGVAGVSTSHFKSLFRATTGLPPHQFIVKRRVEYAVRLLARGVRPLSDVALAAGFSDQSHFARCMRRLLGMTPKEFTSRL